MDSQYCIRCDSLIYEGETSCTVCDAIHELTREEGASALSTLIEEVGIEAVLLTERFLIPGQVRRNWLRRAPAPDYQEGSYTHGD